MAQESAINKAVIIKGTIVEHFQNEVFSWHQINGMSGEEMLPALLISNMHPSYFRNHSHGNAWGKDLLNQSEADGMKLILIPFRKFCTNSTEVVELIQKVFADIKNQKDIFDFAIAKEMKKGKGRAVVDAVILEPNIAGIGIDLKKLIGGFLKPK